MSSPTDSAAAEAVQPGAASLSTQGPWHQTDRCVGTQCYPEDEAALAAVTDYIHNSDTEADEEEASLEQQQEEAEVDEEPPVDLLCPISLELMVDPVVTTTGMTYNRGSIEEWWFQCNKDTCPTTQLKVASTFLVPNTHLRAQVQRWLAQHPRYLARLAAEAGGQDSIERANSSSSNNAASDGTPVLQRTELRHAQAPLPAQGPAADQASAQSPVAAAPPSSSLPAGAAGLHPALAALDARPPWQGDVEALHSSDSGAQLAALQRLAAAAPQQADVRCHYYLVTSGAYLQLLDLLRDGGAHAGAGAEGRCNAVLLLDCLARIPRAQRVLLEAGYLKALAALLGELSQPSLPTTRRAAAAVTVAICAAPSGEVTVSVAATPASPPAPTSLSPEEVAAAAAAVHTLAGASANAVKLLRTGALAGLHALLQQQPAAAAQPLQRAARKRALQALLCLSEHPGVAKHMGAGSGLRLLLDLLHAAEPGFLNGTPTQGKFAVDTGGGAVSKQRTVAIKVAVVAGSAALGGELVAGTTVEWSDEERQLLLQVLANLADADDTKVSLVNFGAVELLLSALQQRGTGVCQLASSLLALLASCPEAALRMAAAPGCIAALTGMLTGALAPVAPVEASAAPGREVEALPSPGREVEADIALHRDVCRRTASNLLFLLVMSNGRGRAPPGPKWWGAAKRETAAQAIIDGALPPLVDLLTAGDDEAYEKVAMLIKLLATSKGMSNKIRFLEAGAIPPLVRLLSSESWNCREHAAQALEGLAEDPTVCMAAVGSGAVAKLRALARANPDQRRAAAAALEALTSSCGGGWLGHGRQAAEFGWGSGPGGTSRGKAGEHPSIANFSMYSYQRTSLRSVV